MIDLLTYLSCGAVGAVAGLALREWLVVGTVDDTLDDAELDLADAAMRFCEAKRAGRLELTRWNQYEAALDNFTELHALRQSRRGHNSEGLS